MKKILTLILALTMLFALAACGQSAAPKTFTVGICQFVQHGINSIGVVSRLADSQRQTVQNLPTAMEACVSNHTGNTFSNMVGNSARNRRYFEEKYPQFSMRFAVDESLPDMAFRVSES